MRYLDSRFLRHSTDRDLFDQYNIAVKGRDDCKICQISMDGPNVKFLQKVQDDRIENEQPALIDIGSCGLHTVYGAFKCTSCKLKKILSGSYQILPDSPLRRDDCQSVTNSVIYHLKCCATR